MNNTESYGSGAGAGIMLLILGILLPILFIALVQWVDIVMFLMVFGLFGVVVFYSEVYLSLPSGVALGAGMLLTSFVAQDWWLVGLAMAAWVVKLSKYGLDLVGEDLKATRSSLPYSVSDWFKRQTPEE